MYVQSVWIPILTLHTQFSMTKTRTTLFLHYFSLLNTSIFAGHGSFCTYVVYFYAYLPLLWPREENKIVPFCGAVYHVRCQRVFCCIWRVQGAGLRHGSRVSIPGGSEPPTFPADSARHEEVGGACVQPQQGPASTGRGNR